MNGLQPRPLSFHHPTAGLCLSPKRRLLPKIFLSPGRYVSQTAMSSHFHALKERGMRGGEPAWGRAPPMLPCGLVSPAAVSVLWCRNSMWQAPGKDLCAVREDVTVGRWCHGFLQNQAAFQLSRVIFFLFPKGTSDSQLFRKFSSLGPRFLGTTKSLFASVSLKLTSASSQLGSWSGWETADY